jgi:hypothetical protein
MKAIFLALIFCCSIVRTDEPAAGTQFISRIYYPELLYRMRPGVTAREAAKTEDQLRFAEAYTALQKEEEARRLKDKQHSWNPDLFMDALRRCGIEFPKGTTVRWLPTYPPLLVTHTPEAMKRIEALMDLKLKR